ARAPEGDDEPRGDKAQQVGASYPTGRETVDDVALDVGRHEVEGRAGEGERAQHKRLPLVRPEIARHAQKRAASVDAGGADPVLLGQESSALLAPQALGGKVDGELMALGQLLDAASGLAELVGRAEGIGDDRNLLAALQAQEETATAGEGF